MLQRLGKGDEAMHLFESSARGDPRDHLSRHNLASTARQFLAAGGWSLPVVAFILIQLARLARMEGASGWTAAFVALGCFAIVFVGMRFLRRRREGLLSPATRALLADERRRMRRRPWTWQPTSRWLPWPVWLLVSVPPQVIAVLGGLVLVLMLANAGGYDSGDWLAFGGVALFTAFFVLRWRDLPSD